MSNGFKRQIPFPKKIDSIYFSDKPTIAATDVDRVTDIRPKEE